MYDNLAVMSFFSSNLIKKNESHRITTVAFICFLSSSDLPFVLHLIALGMSLVYPIEKKAEHLDNRFSSDLIKK